MLPCPRGILIATFGGLDGMSKKRISLAVAGLRAALIAVLGLAFVASGFAAPAVAGGYGSILGTVTLPQGGPAAHAQVCLFTEPSDGWSSECAPVDASGGFRFAGLAPGSYSLSASADGYVTSYLGGSPYLKDRLKAELGGGAVLHQDLQLRSGATITGKVLDSAGRPFGYDLTLSLRGPAEDPRPGSELQSGTPTDGRRPYRFGPVPDGTYRIVAESTITCTPQQVDPCQWAETTVVVAGGRAITAPTLRLTGGTGFSGTVSFPAAVGPDQPPSRLYQLDVYTRAGVLVRSGVYEASTIRGTALRGSYQLHLKPGRYQLRFTPVGGSASYCLGCAGGLSTTTGRLRSLGTITLSGPVKALSTGGVRIDGTPAVGQTLAVVTTGWPVGARLQYQWYRNGHRIRGAQQATRVLTAGDLHRRISVRVRASLDRARSVQVVAGLSSRIRAGQLVGGTATVTGSPMVGQRLVAGSTGWRPSGVRLHYRWLRDGHSIRRATGRSYQVRASDRGHRLSVRVTAHKAGYRSSTMISAALVIS